MPEITNQQSLINDFVSLMPPRTATAAKAVSLGNAPAEVVNKLLQAAQGEPLWDGFWDYEDKILGRPYPSQSEADFALLGAIVRRAHSVGAPENMVADAAIRVFEKSGLYRAEKRHRVLTQDIPNLITSHYSSASVGIQRIVGSGGRQNGYAHPHSSQLAGDANSQLISEVNQQYCLIEGAGIYDKDQACFVKPEQFRQLYSNRLIEFGSPTKSKLVTLDRIWNASHLREQYKALELAPDEPERTSSGALNTYRGFSVDPKPGNIEPFLGLLAHVITNARDQELFLKFIAYKLQHPETTYSFSLVIQSQAQGVGKNMLVEACIKLFDARHFRVVGQEVFSDQFTEWQRHKLFIVADEVSSANSRTVADKIKGWITAAENSINGKGQPRFIEPNKIAYIFVSNHADAVFMDVHDRRYAVLECGNTKLAPSDANEFVKWRDNGGSSSLLDYFQKLDTKGFNQHTHAPMTRAKRAMINANKSDLESWVETIVTATSISNLLGREIVTANELVFRYHRETDHQASTKAMGNALSKAGITQLDKQALRPDGRRPRVYALANANKHARLSSKQLGDYMDQNMIKL